MAKKFNRTVSVHCVDAYGTLRDVLESESFFGSVVIHSFSGNGDQIRDFMRLELATVYFSVSGKCPRESVIPLIPSERILVETDSPDQPFSDIDSVQVPKKLDSFTNDCSQLPLVVQRVAIAKNLSFQDVANLTEVNTCRAFQISSF